MRFRFIGDPRHGGEGPSHIRFGDIAIGRVEFVDVPDWLAEKLESNGHFEAEVAAMIFPRTGSALLTNPIIVANAAEDFKSQLIAEAESLGIDVDRRWGIPRLQAEIDKALAANG